MTKSAPKFNEIIIFPVFFMSGSPVKHIQALSFLMLNIIVIKMASNHSQCCKLCCKCAFELQHLYFVNINITFSHLMISSTWALTNAQNVMTNETNVTTYCVFSACFSHFCMLFILNLFFNVSSLSVFNNLLQKKI